MTSNTTDEDIGRYVAEAAEPQAAPDGTTYYVISLMATGSISSSRAVPPIEVEIIALKQGIIPLRYLRNIGTIGLDGQIELLQSTVAVVGAGGLGSTIIELLAKPHTPDASLPNLARS